MADTRARVTPGTRRPYTAGHFELLIDGKKTTAYLKSIDGGHVKAALIDEPIGPENMRIKHMSTVEIDPISVEFGISGANEILHWIQDSVDKRWGRRNGQITHADFDLRSTYTHEFTDALVTEVTFPTLDGASREAAYMKMKFQPERVVTTKNYGPQLIPNLGPKQKSWTASAFRLNIDGIDEMKYVNKIESFTIKQGVKKLYTGRERYPEIEPTKIEFPNITGTIALDYADKLLKWFDDYVRKGQADPKAQRTGSLEFLDPTRGTAIFEVSFDQVGITNVQVVQSTANADQIKRVKFELYVGAMKLAGPGVGLE